MRTFWSTTGHNLKTAGGFWSLPLSSLSSRRLLWLGIAAIVIVAAITAWVWYHGPLAAMPHRETVIKAAVDHHATATPSLLAAPAQVGTAAPSTHHASLQINNQAVPLPETGTIHKDIKTTTGHTTVDASVQSHSTGSSQTSSSLTIDVHSSSSLTKGDP